MGTLSVIATVIAIIGALNWLSIGIFNFNFVSALLGTGMFANLVYILVGLAGLWLIYYLVTKLVRSVQEGSQRT